MSDGEDADIDHRPAQGGFHDTVAHADDEEEEERKRIPSSVENRNNYHQCLGPCIQTILVLELWKRSAANGHRMEVTCDLP